MVKTNRFHEITRGQTLVLAFVYSYSVILHKEHSLFAIPTITDVYFWMRLFTHVIYAVPNQVYQHFASTILMRST